MTPDEELEEISNGDIWEFVQTHKNETQDEFASWLLGQHYRLKDKIIKAVCAWNRRH